MKQVKELTVQETALHLGVTLKYVRDLLYEHKLSGARKVGRQWLIPVTAVESRLRARDQSAQPSIRLRRPTS